MESNQVFRTKAGYCHLTKDSIILTKDGDIENISRLTFTNSITRSFIIYSVVIAGFVFLAIREFQAASEMTAFFFLLFALLLMIGLINSINNSAEPVIQKSRIDSIEFRKAIPGATRSCFVVYFKNNKNKTKKRLIMLPGSLSKGKDETIRALAMMKTAFGSIKGV